MTILHANLFETLRLYTAEEQFIDLGSPTTRSLIAYLLYHRNRPTDRRRLAFTFWPEATESAARRNLRQYLHHIRVALEPIDPGETLILADSSNIQFNPDVEITIDTEIFLHNTHPEASLQEVEHALSLYTGDLLEDVYDDWCAPERERLRQIWLGTMDRYSQALQIANQLGEALKVTQKWVNAEPFDENARRRLMQFYALTGDRARAIHAYQSFAELLQQELGTEPLPETQILLQSIQSGQSLPENNTNTHLIQQQKPVPLPRARALPALPFVGRKNEISTLEKAYQQARSGVGRLVLITGEAGIGKTQVL